MSYIKNSGDFLKKVKHLGQIQDGAILVTADVVGLYPIMAHKAGLEALRRRLNKCETSKIPSDDIVQMAEIVHKKYFWVQWGGEKTSITNGVISTDLYIKPTDGHQYLHYKSSHPEHIKNSIPYSQALRLSRICSSEKDFKGHVDRMKEWFLARDYPKNVVNEQINKVVFGKSQPSRKNSENSVSFVVTPSP